MMLVTGMVVFALVMITNIQYAMEDYGMSENSLHAEMLAQISSTGGGGSGGTTSDCWRTYTRGGNYYRRICKFTSSGITENCKVITDLSHYEGLNTCQH